MKITNQLVKQVQENWLLAAKKLDFRIICPFTITVNGNDKIIFAYLPTYGSKKGMIIDLITVPEFETNNEIIEWAKINNYYYSFINIESYLQYDEEFFLRTLKDWGDYK